MSVADPNDQALRVANDLIAKHPRVNARVSVGVYTRPLQTVL